MKKWMAAISLVLLMLVGVMPINILKVEAGIKDPTLPIGTSASVFFEDVNIGSAAIGVGESVTFSVGNFTQNTLEAIRSGTMEITKIKWNVKKNSVDYTEDASFSAMFSESTNTDTFTINAVEGNCILDGAKVSLTIYTLNLVQETSQTLTFSETATLTVNTHASGDEWIVDEEASNGALEVSHKKCIYCEKYLETKTVVTPLATPVYVGGQALQYAGDSVTGGSGTATLYIGQDGSPVLVLDNYVYEGAGYHYTDNNNYAGIYYEGSDTLYLFCGPNDGNRAVSQNTITVTAADAAVSRGIHVPNGTLYIGTTDNGIKDTLTVTAGAATIFSHGIRAAEVKTHKGNETLTIDLYTSTDVDSAGQYALTSNCVINAAGGNTTGNGASSSSGISCTTLTIQGGTVNAKGGNAEGYAYPYSYGICCTEAIFSGGEITAIGGKASYENLTGTQFEAHTYGIYAETMTISGANVTAIGGTCGGHVSGNGSESIRNLRYSYGCYGDITMTSGSLTATGGDLLMEDSTTGGRDSYGIYGGIAASDGTINATGGNTIGGNSYGIYLNEDSTFSGTAVVTATTKTENTDDYRYGIYAKEVHSDMAMTISVNGSASVTATVAEEARLGTSGIYVNSGYISFIQTDGTVVASAPTKDANQAGAYFIQAAISGGTFDATAKTMAFYAYELNLTGGAITGTANSTLGDTLAVDSTGIQIGALTMTGGSITGQGGESSTSASCGVRIVQSADVSGGTITGTGGHVSSETKGVMSYGIDATGLTLSGGTVTGTGGEASSSSLGVYITSNATISKDAKLVGQGGISERDGSTGIFGKNMSVADSAIVTGTGGQAKAGNSTGISISGDFTMSEGSSAQVTGNGATGNNSRGMYFSCSSNSLAGGTLTAKGGASYTTASLGIYIYYYDFLMNGTLVTATGHTNAVGGDDKFVYSEAMVASTNVDGSNEVTLQCGSHSVSSLAKYKYLKAGTTDQLGVAPGKRDISDAVINLGPTLTYNGSEQNMTVTSVMLGGVDLLASGFVTVTDNIVTDAGTYTLKVTANEESLYTGSATKEFTVNRLSITPDITITGGPYAWGSIVALSDVKVKHGDVELVSNVDYTVESYINNVGENGGVVRVYSQGGSNYTWNEWVTAYYDVVKAENPVVVTTPVTVIRGGNQVVFKYSNNQGGSPSYSITAGEELGCTITNGVLTSGDTEGTVTVQATFAAGTTCNEAVRTITVTITDKKEAELLSVSQSSIEYGATLQSPNYYTPNGTKTTTITYEGTTRSGVAYPISTEKPTDAGSYTVYVVCETSDTIYSGSDTFEILPKRIPSSNIMLACDELVYNGEPQTIKVTEVYDSALSKKLVEGVDYEVTDNVATNVGGYWLTITGKGNYTKTATEHYNITKATPTAADFIIPSYDITVDYTGVAVALPLPTTEKIGMGNVYFSYIPTAVGAHIIYFNVSEGTNYTAATNLEYGSLTINQIDRPTTVDEVEVIVGGNRIDLDNYVRTEGYPAKTYNIEGEALGCSIDGSFFTSGTETGTVKVRVTLDQNDTYRETDVWFTVTVKAKNTASLTVTQHDVEYDYGEPIWNLSPDFDGQAGTLVSQTMVYEGTLWNSDVYASSETEPTQAGTYTVTVTYESKDTIYTGSTTFKINPTQISGSITLGNKLTYTGEPQTQTIAKVQTGDYTYTEADYDISGNVATNAGEYTLTLTGKGNFTGTTSAYYSIAKATPKLSDFNIPELTPVDYTGAYIEVALPTSKREGMGEVYLTGANGIINAGNHTITFGVHRGQNYEAASGFAYGTLTVNKVAHPMTVANAVVGINLKQINLSTRVTQEFGYAPTFEFVTPEENRLGCQINGATFTSGNVPGIVTVRATVSEGTNYLETSKTFTVTVVEEGGVKVWGAVTSSGDSNDETTIQLLQDGVVKYEMAKVGNSPTYTFDGVAAGTYTLRISKVNHLTHEQEITVASEDVHVETVELKTESDILAEKVKNVTIRHNCSFGNDFTLLYAIPKSELEGFENIRLSVEKDVYSGDTLTGTTTVELPWTTYFISSTEYYRFDYKNIAAMQIGDDLRATLIAEYNGVEYYGTVDVYNLKDYAYERLSNSTKDTYKRLLVDMLDYCSAAQVNFSYRETDLVNEELTSEQRTYSSGAYAELQNNAAVVVECPNKTISTIRKNVSYSNRIEPLFAMDLSGYSDRSRITMHVEYIDMYGEEKILNISGSTFEYNSSIGMYYGVVSTLTAAELRKIMEVTILYDGEAISDTIAYSVESYIYERLAASTSENYKSLLKKMIIFGDSCEANFSN